jgi:hypothetical protein
LRWILRAGHLEYEVQLAYKRRKLPTSPHERDPWLTKQFLDQFASNLFNSFTLKDFLRQELFESCSGLSDQQVYEKVAGLIHSGRIVIEPLPTMPISPTSEGFLRVLGPAEDKGEKQIRILGEELTWIAIQMVDHKGRPVAHESYRLLRADGTEVSNEYLNEEGYARVDGLKPGEYQVSFPKLEQRPRRTSVT